MATKSLPLTGSNLGRLLRLTREELWRKMASELAREGLDLNFSQYIVLKNLRNGPAMSSTLAECAAINAGAMTRVIDKLAEQGIVERHPSPTDRRAWQVDLTSEGRKLIKRMEICGENTLASAFKDVSAKRLAELEATLEQIVSNLASDKDHNG